MVDEKANGSANSAVRRGRSASGWSERKVKPRLPRSRSATPFGEDVASNVTTVLRIRPLTAEEAGVDVCVEVTDTEAAITVDKGGKQVFTFSHACGTNASQCEVYEKVAQPLVRSVFDGYNVCVLAYGQTGTGKTYSMTGVPNDPGVVSRFCSDVFALATAKTDNNFKIRAAFYEIYMEKVYDLLDIERKALRVRGVDKVYVEGAKFVLVSGLEQFIVAHHSASSRRATANNGYHAASSRSHFITHIIVNQSIKNDVGFENEYLKSNIYLVDLAGSERAGQNEDISESISINSSLSVLHRLIFCSGGDGFGYGSHRESALTYILRDCFCSNARMSLLATVSPRTIDRTHTRATCDFATAVRSIHQQATPNVSPLEVQLTELRTLVADLKERSLLSFELPKAPAVIELDEDPSLCTWKPISTQLSYSANELGSTAVSFTLSDNGDVFAHIFEDDVAFNGTLLAKDSTVPVSHGDRIVIHFNRCLLLFLDDSDKSVLMKYNYRSTKLEFLDANFTRLQTEFEATLRKEAETEKRLALAEMDEELRARREELERLNALAASSQQKELKVERQSIDAEIKDRSALRQCFEVETIDIVSSSVSDAAERLRILNIQAVVKVVNCFIERFGKQDLYEVVLTPGKDGDVEIRMKEKKLGVSGTVKIEDLEELRDILQEIHRAWVVPSDAERRAGELLFTFCRQRSQISNAGRVAEIVQTALINSMNEAAVERKTNIKDLRRSVAGRRTSAFSKRIAAAVGAAEEEDPVEENMPELLSTLASAVKEEDTIDSKEDFLRFALKCLQKMRTGVPTLRSIQRGAIRGNAMVRLLTSYNASVVRLSTFMSVRPNIADPDVLRSFREMQVVWKTCKDLYVAWLPLSSKVERGGVGEQTLEVMLQSVDKVSASLGKCAFWMASRASPKSSIIQLHSMFLEGMKEGLMEAVDEANVLANRKPLLIKPVGLALDCFLRVLTIYSSDMSTLNVNAFRSACRLLILIRLLVENGEVATNWNAVVYDVARRLRCWREETRRDEVGGPDVEAIIEKACKILYNMHDNCHQ